MPAVGRPLPAAAIGDVIRRASKRCGLSPPRYGSHILRHTLATHLLQNGAALKQISDVLRHRSIETTNIYAKVDLRQLAQVALPWPEEKTVKHKTFLEAAEEYIEYRRNLGYAVHEGKELHRFARYADKIGHKGPITTELSLQWAQLPQNCQPVYRARRLGIVRQFARYMKLVIPETEIPPEGILGPSHYPRATPHIYSEEEIAAIMRAARNLTPANGLRPHTYVTLFGLLASTGMRISEALSLSRENVHIGSGTITIVESKFHKSRIVPLHPTATEALKSYIVKRDKKYPIPKTKTFFVSNWGTSLKYGRVFRVFRKIVFDFGWCKKTGDRGPRIHDMRHTFAARRLLEWYRNGDNVHQKISLLSAYLGHAKVANTYWYLTAVPELMAIAASRFERFAYKEEETNND